ncbi:hypothetical protein [Flagellimonas sp.]|uniref:hypothetical protein n=1 Tax=Flagellimonas sp. TaxID=2058762 RepID=UPI003B52FFCE
MQKDQNFYKIAKELFVYASAKEIGEHLSLTTSQFIQLDIGDYGSEVDGNYYSNCVFMTTTLMNFIHELEKEYFKREESLRAPELKAS